jgi:hypothetical protein
MISHAVKSHHHFHTFATLTLKIKDSSKIYKCALHLLDRLIQVTQMTHSTAGPPAIHRFSHPRNALLPFVHAICRYYSLEEPARHLYVDNDHPGPEPPKSDHPKKTKRLPSRDIVCCVQYSADSDYIAHPMDDHPACILHTKLQAEADAPIVQPHCNIRLTSKYSVHPTGALKLRYTQPHTRNTNTMFNLLVLVL